MAREKGTFDFSGFATKYNTLCSDGRTIAPGAFKHHDGLKVPLVWQHLHTDPNNVLGYAVLEHRDEGLYAYGYLNNTAAGIQAKALLEHKDITAMSIFANQLVQKNKLVHSGSIKELSLVLAGANPGALIENVTIRHGDGTENESEDEVIIFTDATLDDTEKDSTESVSHADSADGEETVDDVIKSMTDRQQKVLYAIVAQAIAESKSGDLSQSDTDEDDETEGETVMKSNVFESKDEKVRPTLTHDQMAEIFADAQKLGSLKESFLAHAGTYGIDDIDYLFPDAHLVDGEPSFETRRMGWVSGWMSATKHSPFSRLKKVWADLTPDAARAKGYITGEEKVEQVFAVLKRVTTPTTVYKKQKLDRDDIVDITDFNVVTWMKREMRFMLDEELARAALVGDQRTFGVDDDAIDPSAIRPIYGDVSQFVHYLTLEAAVTDYLDIIEAIQLARVNYKGTGTPNLYTTNAVLTGMLLLKDTTNRRIYKSVDELANDLRVASIIEVEVLEGVQRDDAAPFTADLLGIMVNPHDYTYGADRGGEVNMFDDFDIDYNQQKYLIETRVSGSLLNPKSALVIERKTA